MHFARAFNHLLWFKSIGMKRQSIAIKVYKVANLQENYFCLLFYHHHFVEYQIIQSSS